MKQDQSPFQIERRLTPALFDHYVAQARAERAKAIAQFGGWIAKSLRAGAAMAIRAVRRETAVAVQARRLAPTTRRPAEP